VNQRERLHRHGQRGPAGGAGFVVTDPQCHARGTLRQIPTLPNLFHPIRLVEYHLTKPTDRLADAGGVAIDKAGDPPAGGQDQIGDYATVSAGAPDEE
jgi:hypothetical protein